MKQIGLLLIPLLLLAACSTELTHTDHDHDGDGEQDHAPEDHHEHHDMHEMEVTSEASFVVNMIPHHQEAVDTAQIIYDSTENEQLKDLAKRIVDAQEAEIEMMNGWVAEWYADAEPATYMNMMPDLLTFEGKGRDAVFLIGMIKHHEMAVHMAEDVLALDPREEVAEFAEAVIAVQTAEIEEMRSLLE